MNKLILVSCDSKDVYDKFVDIIASKLANVVKIDYETLITNRTSNLFNSSSLLYKNDYKLIDDVIKAVDKYGHKTSYDWLVDSIDTRDYDGVKMFVRVNNIKIINKLKRLYKRPNYVTLRITNTNINIKKRIGNLNNYKWNSKLQYVDNIYLNKQAITFMKKNIPSMLFVNN